MLTLEKILDDYSNFHQIIIKCNDVEKYFYAWQYDCGRGEMYDDIYARYGYDAQVKAFSEDNNTLKLTIKSPKNDCNGDRKVYCSYRVSWSRIIEFYHENDANIDCEKTIMEQLKTGEITPDASDLDAVELDSIRKW